MGPRASREKQKGHAAPRLAAFSGERGAACRPSVLDTREIALPRRYGFVTVNARPFGGQLAKVCAACATQTATAALQSAKNRASMFASVLPGRYVGAVFRRGRSFCLRVCGCAPSAARPAKSAASALSRRVRRMYARPGGLSNERRIRRRAGALRFRPASWPACCAGSPSFADRARRAVEFLVEHALFVGGQTAASAARLLVRFAPDHLEPMMQLALAAAG